MNESEWLDRPQVDAARQILSDTIADPDAPVADRIAAANGIVLAAYLEHSVSEDLGWIAENVNILTPPVPERPRR